MSKSTDRQIHTLVEDAAAALRGVGYPICQTNVRKPGSRTRVEADLVAWGPDSEGVLRPLVTVEVKSPGAKDDGSALAQLNRLAAAFGTPLNYLYDGSWRIASDGFLRLQLSDGPERLPAVAVSGWTNNLQATSGLLEGWLWQEADALRGAGMGPESLKTFIRRIGESDWMKASGDAPPPTVLLDVLYRWATSGRRMGEHGAAPLVPGALASLVHPARAGVALDPACGLGSTLVAIQERASAAQARLELRGVEINRDVAEAAVAILRIMRVEASIATADFLHDPVDPADYLVCQPPMGLQLREPVLLGNGRSTMNGDLAFIDRCCRSLREGGRGVIHLGRGWLAQGGEVRDLRAWLAAQYEVVALVGLPSGAVAGTHIPSVVLVVQASGHPRGDALVADLGPDWPAQLSPGGQFLTTYLERLEEVGG